MARLSAAEIRQYAYDAGFRGEALDTAVAIALAESNGSTSAYNGKDKDRSYGLWQINMIGKMGPDRRDRYGLSSNDDLFDPAANARAAFDISGGGKNFRPWTTYTKGTYQRYLGSSQGPAGRTGAGGAVVDRPGGSAMAVKKKPLTEAELVAYVRTNYGFAAGFLSNPEIRKVLLKAAKLGWGSGELQGALYATDWWKETAQVSRVWEALKSTDPAEYALRTQRATQAVRMLAKQMGVTLDAKQEAIFASRINKYGWTEDMIRQGVAAQFDYNPKKLPTGQAAVTVDMLRESAAQYLVPLSDATLEKWTRDIVGGVIDPDSFHLYLKEQAKSRFPGLAEAIDRGVTIQQFADPYREQTAQLLEITPAQVNLMDPRWMKMLDQRDPKTGVATSMSLADAAEYARRQPEFAKTKQAKATAASFGSFLTETFGKVAV